MDYLNVIDLAQYWSAISEADRQELVSGIKGTIEYGSTVTFQRLPDEAKLRIRGAYARHQKLVSDLEKK